MQLQSRRPFPEAGNYSTTSLLNPVDESLLEAGFFIGDDVLAGGALHGLRGQFPRGSQGGDQRGDFGVVNIAAGELGFVALFLRGGGDSLGIG